MTDDPQDDARRAQHFTAPGSQIFADLHELDTFARRWRMAAFGFATGCLRVLWTWGR